MRLRNSKVMLVLSMLLVFVLLAGCAGGAGKSADKQAAASAAPGTAAPSGPVNLVFWTLWDGGDVDIAKKIFDEYNNTNTSKVKIELQQQDNAQYYTKLKTSILGGTGPDFAIAHVGGFITGMAADGNILPLDEAAAKAKVDIKFDKYTQSVVEAGKVNGKLYTVPLDNLIRVMMYNKALLKDTGLLDKDGNLVMEKGYAGFVKGLQTIKDKKPEVAPLIISMRPPQLVLSWLTLYAQMGGSNFIDMGAKKAVFDDAKALAALKAYKDIYDKYVPPKLTAPADFNMFTTGKGAIYLDGAWNVSASADVLGKDFGVTTFPQLFEKDAHVATNHGFILPVKKNRTDAQTKAAMEFIKWWGENNAKWCKAGHLPGFTSAVDTAEFKALPYHKYYMDTLKAAIPLPVIPNVNLHQAPEVTNPIQNAILGDMKPEDAVKAVKNDLNQLIPKLVN